MSLAAAMKMNRFLVDFVDLQIVLNRMSGRFEVSKDGSWSPDPKSKGIIDCWR